MAGHVDRMSIDCDAVRAALLASHGDVLDDVLAVADGLDDAWDSGRELADTLRQALVAADVLERCPALLATAVDAAGATLSAEPVAAPPYVVVGATGVTCRATLPDGRLLVRVEPFAVRRDPARYVRVADDRDDAVSVEYVEHE